jgi:hypothetical protein
VAERAGSVRRLAAAAAVVSAVTLASCGDGSPEVGGGGAPPAQQARRDDPATSTIDLDAVDPETLRRVFVDELIANTSGAVNEEQAGCIADKAMSDGPLMERLSAYGVFAPDQPAVLPDEATMTELLELFADCGVEF